MKLVLFSTLGFFLTSALSAYGAEVVVFEGYKLKSLSCESVAQGDHKVNYQGYVEIYHPDLGSSEAFKVFIFTKPVNRKLVLTEGKKLCERLMRVKAEDESINFIVKDDLNSISFLVGYTDRFFSGFILIGDNSF